MERPTYFFPHASRQWPLDLIMGQIFLWASFIAIVVTFVLTVFTKKIFDDKNPYEQGVDPHWKLWPIIIGTGTFGDHRFLEHLPLPPSHHSVREQLARALLSFSLLSRAIVLNVRYTEYLFKKSFVSGHRGDWLLQWALLGNRHRGFCVWFMVLRPE